MSNKSRDNSVPITNIKAKKNFIDPGWPNYLTNKFTYKYKEVPQKPKDKIAIDSNRKFGLSSDNK